ncbi:MAG: conjugal transfer protein TrbN [Paracoccus denitrificans]|uniref:Conjugal transfer protein TrbN n=1 Tax=Paracoccus denitrificans TaxID=266 RepID=A0A533I0W0_PARDE|nr:MAG: conjugal transfer protein TrbN [Paracoccus denitrificans]
MPADIPPAIHERVVCSIGAAAKYGVPANIILAVAQKEGGKPGQWVRNTNATYDVGAMQFNTAYIRTLARYGIGTADVAQAGCYPYDLAAWRLRGHIKNDAGDVWTRVANYHSRTPRYNAPYRAAIMGFARQWGNWLSARFHTYDTLTVAMPQGTATRQAVDTINAAPIKQAPVPAAKPSPYSSPVRVASVPTRGLKRAPAEPARPSPYSAPIRVSYDRPAYVPRTISVEQ